MFQSKWKEEYKEMQLSYFADLQADILERVNIELKKGFENTGEMAEVFEKIADEFSVSAEDVWDVFNYGE